MMSSVLEGIRKSSDSVRRSNRFSSIGGKGERIFDMLVM
jgi:hypothetical protein